MDLDLVDRLIARLGFDPNKNYGPHHGASLSAWIAFGLIVWITICTPIILGAINW